MRSCKTVPEKLRCLRETLGYSQEYVAAEWNISQAALSKLESGKSEWSWARILQAAQFYGVSVDELQTQDIHVLARAALT